MAMFLAKARARMERKGTVGKFTRMAKKAGKSIAEEAASIRKNPRASTTEKREAVFAQNMRKIAARRRHRG